MRNGTHTPAPGHFWSRFFRNQENLRKLTASKDLSLAVRAADAVVFAVRHEPCLALLSDDLMEMTGKPAAVIDCFGTLSDKEIRCYFVLWTRSERLGRGDVKREKDGVRAKMIPTKSSRLVKSATQKP